MRNAACGNTRSGYHLPLFGRNQRDHSLWRDGGRLTAVGARHREGGKSETDYRRARCRYIPSSGRWQLEDLEIPRLSGVPVKLRGQCATGRSPLTGFLGDPAFPPYKGRPPAILRTSPCTPVHAPLRDSVSRDRSGRSFDRTLCDPLVCGRLYCRAGDRLAVLPGTGWTAAASGCAPGCRRFPGMGNARGRARRADRIRSLLQAGLLYLSPDRGALRMARWDVVPWRRSRRDHRDHFVYPCPSNTAVCLLGHHNRGDPDRPFLRPHRKFHQWRAVWAAEQLPLGDDLPEWRPGAAASEPALRSLLRGHSAVFGTLRRRAAPCEAAPGGGHGIVSGGLRRRPDVGRTVPAAGPAVGFPDFRYDNGPALVDPGADRRHPDHRLGAARASPCPVVSEEIADKIVRRIRAEGPLTVAAYMAMALHDPEDGYYASRGPIGAAGDFTTAPEISQVFCGLVGLWCAELWDRAGRPDPA